MSPIPVRRARRLAFAMLLALSASACSTLESLVPRGDSEVPAALTRSERERAAIGTREPGPGEKIVVLPMGPEDLNCPSVDLLDEAASVRSGGQSSESVRYQFEITKLARECTPLGAQFSIKVGVSGKLLIGPAGKSGAYRSQLRVVVTSEISKKTAFSKAYPIEANTGAAAEAPFEIVTEPIILPFTRKELADDYTVTVGFDNGGGGNADRRRSKRRNN